MTGLFIIFALSNKSIVTIEIFSIQESFRVWVLVLYSILLGMISMLLLILPSIIMLKSNHKRLKEKFEILSDSKLTEFVKDDDEIIE